MEAETCVVVVTVVLVTSVEIRVSEGYFCLNLFELSLVNSRVSRVRS